MQNVLESYPGWVIDSVIDYTVSISNYNPLAGSSYINFSKELDYY